MTTGRGSIALRSLLFAPAGDERKLRKAMASSADAVVADLEDAVAPSARAAARETLLRVSASLVPRRPLMVRVNQPGTADFDEDLKLVKDLDLYGVVIPKATSASTACLPAGLPRVMPIVETAQGVRESYEIASVPGVFALMFGAIDLAAEIDFRWRADGLHLLYARSQVVLNSAAAGLAFPIDSAWVKLDDPEGFLEEARVARSLGFQGKVCIHPAQLELAHRVFDGDQIAWAEATMNAYRAALARGEGVVAVDGEMVDRATLRRAERILVAAGLSDREVDVTHNHQAKEF